MHKDIKIFQTLRHEKIENIIKDGPYPCELTTSWLGVGYYFWDSFIELSHAWGNTAKGMDMGYVVTSTTFKIDDKCLNLVDNYFHLKQLINSITYIKENKIFQPKDLTLKNVITYMLKNNIADFRSIRIYGINSLPNYTQRFNILNIQKKDFQPYINLIPPIQICIINKEDINKDNYKIESLHPKETNWA